MRSFNRVPVRFLAFFSALSLLPIAAALPAAAASPPLVSNKYFDKTEGAFFVLVP